MFGFSDETYIDVSSGKGGDGAVSFRREKYVPRGGPDGGDGGKGGDVVFVVDKNLRTLAGLKRRRSYDAEPGRNGSGARCAGKSGRDVEIAVPPGTVIKDAETGRLIKDLAGEKRFVFLKGGKGGLGNWHFRSSVRQTPRFAFPGRPGQAMRVGVELLIIADIGLVGFPNAGKSSLLNLLTNARSKVADYPFTTKIPQLGMMRYGDQDLVLADIPGIIEGASKGLGMGIKFLKHISRTEALAFLIDLSGKNWREAFGILKKELESYAPALLDKKRVVIGTKLDEDEAPARLEELAASCPGEDVIGLSIYLDQTVDVVKRAFVRLAGGPGGDGFAAPGGRPADAPGGRPANAPSGQSANAPSGQPANAPSGQPTDAPCGQPANAPSGQAANAPCGRPAERGGE